MKSGFHRAYSHSLKFNSVFVHSKAACPDYISSHSLDGEKSLQKLWFVDISPTMKDQVTSQSVILSSISHTT